MPSVLLTIVWQVLIHSSLHIPELSTQSRGYQDRPKATAHRMTTQTVISSAARNLMCSEEINSSKMTQEIKDDFLTHFYFDFEASKQSVKIFHTIILLLHFLRLFSVKKEIFFSHTINMPNSFHFKSLQLIFPEIS